MRQSWREQPTSTQHVLLQEALDARAALVTLDVAAIIEGMPATAPLTTATHPPIPAPRHASCLTRGPVQGWQAALWASASSWEAA